MVAENSNLIDNNSCILNQSNKYNNNNQNIQNIKFEMDPEFDKNTKKHKKTRFWLKIDEILSQKDFKPRFERGISSRIRISHLGVTKMQSIKNCKKTTININSSQIIPKIKSGVQVQPPGDHYSSSSTTSTSTTSSTSKRHQKRHR